MLKVGVVLFVQYSMNRKENLKKNTQRKQKNPPPLKTGPFYPTPAINPVKNPSQCEFWYASAIHHSDDIWMPQAEVEQLRVPMQPKAMLI